MTDTMNDKQVHEEILSIVSILQDIETMKGDIKDRMANISDKADLKPQIVKGLVARMYKNDMQQVASTISELELVFNRIINS